MGSIFSRAKKLIQAPSPSASSSHDDYSSYSIDSIVTMRAELSAKQKEFDEKIRDADKRLSDYAELYQQWSIRVVRAQEFIQANRSNDRGEAMKVSLESAQSYAAVYSEAQIQEKEVQETRIKNVEKVKETVEKLLSFERSHSLKTSLREVTQSVSAKHEPIKDEEELRYIRKLAYTAQALIELKSEELHKEL